MNAELPSSAQTLSSGLSSSPWINANAPDCLAALSISRSGALVKAFGSRISCLTTTMGIVLPAEHHRPFAVLGSERSSSKARNSSPGRNANIIVSSTYNHTHRSLPAGLPACLPGAWSFDLFRTDYVEQLSKRPFIGMKRSRTKTREHIDNEQVMTDASP